MPAPMGRTAEYIPSHRPEKGAFEHIPLFTCTQLRLAPLTVLGWVLCVPTMHTVSFLCHGDTEERVSEAEGRVAMKGPYREGPVILAR